MIVTSEKYFYVFSFVVTRSHSRSLVCTFRHNPVNHLLTATVKSFALPAGMLFTKRNENWAWSQVSIGAALCDVELTHRLVIKINMFASRNRRITWARLSTKKSYGELTYVFSFLCIFSLFKSRFCIPFAARIAYTPRPPPPTPSAAKIMAFRFQFQRNSWPNLRWGSIFVSLC